MIFMRLFFFRLLFIFQMLKGRSTTTFRITSNPNLKTHATYRIKNVDTNGFLLEWLVNNTQD